MKIENINIFKYVYKGLLRHSIYIMVAKFPNQQKSNKIQKCKFQLDMIFLDNWKEFCHNWSLAVLNYVCKFMQNYLTADS
jgi:hypothetical protein